MEWNGKLWMGILLGCLFMGGMIWMVRLRTKYAVPSIQKYTIEWNRPGNGSILVHLSDIHFSRRTASVIQLKTIVNMTNKLAPDVVVITGDVFNYTFDDATLKECCDILEDISSPHVVAVMGNHDGKKTKDRIRVRRALRSIGIHVLHNESLEVNGIKFVGMDDYWRGDFRPVILNDVGRDEIVLVHNPDVAEYVLGSSQATLQLSGHTHGGQIHLPFLKSSVTSYLYKLDKLLPFRAPWHHFSHAVQHWEWGEGHSVTSRENGEDLHVLTSRGLGSHLDMRLFCDPEIAVVHLM